MCVLTSPSGPDAVYAHCEELLPVARLAAAVSLVAPVPGALTRVRELLPHVDEWQQDAALWRWE